MSPACQNEWSQFFRSRDSEDLQLLHAHFTRQRFCPHTHDAFSIGVIERGVLASMWNRGELKAYPGSITAINPGSVHSGYAAEDSGWTYRNFFVGASVVQKLWSDADVSLNTLPMFTSPIIHDRELAHALIRLHRVLLEAPERMNRQSAALTVLGKLFGRHTATRPKRPAQVVGTARLAHVKEFILEHFEIDCGLDELAHVAGLSPHYLLRVFKRTYGLTPYAFLTQTRVEHAQRHLRAGAGIAATASACGFADQSHLTRRFKQTLGITPGQFVAAQ